MYSWKIATPPGRMTAASLSSSSDGEATKQATQRHQLASIPPAGSGSVMRSSSWNSTLASPRSASIARPASTKRAERSTATTRPAGPDDVGEVGGGKARARADVEDLRARADAGAAPALEHGRPPDAMLHAEPLELLVVRAEEVAALLHQSHFALRSRWNR